MGHARDELTQGRHLLRLHQLRLGGLQLVDRAGARGAHDHGADQAADLVRELSQIPTPASHIIGEVLSQDDKPGLIIS